MVVQIPEVNVYMSKVALTGFINNYNAGQEQNADKLKSTHIQLFEKLIQLANKQMKAERRLFIDSEPELLATDTSQPYTLYTNSTFLSEVLQCSKNTVRNRLNRLIKAGAIVEKINHGRHKNYELKLNPQILLINDVENPILLTPSPYIEFSENTENSDLQKLKTQNLSQSIKCPIKNNSNILINAKGVDNSASSIINHKNVASDKTENKHHKLIQPEENNPAKIPDNFAEFNEKEEKSCAKKEEKSPAEKFATYRNRIARWLVAYAITLFWKDKEIFEAEFVRTVQYFEKTYLQGVTYSQMPAVERELRWRLDAVHRYMQRKNYKMTQYPFQYFHTENTTSGFVNTKKWYTTAKLYYSMKNQANKKRKDYEKLHKAIRRYSENPSLSTYRTEHQYIKRNLPHLENEFLSHIGSLTV